MRYVNNKKTKVKIKCQKQIYKLLANQYKCQTNNYNIVTIHAKMNNKLILWT